MNITILDDFVSKENADHLEKIHLAPYFPWHFENSTDDIETIKNYNLDIQSKIKLTHYFNHSFFEDDWKQSVNSNFFNFIIGLFPLEKLSLDRITRFKSNLYTKINNFDKCNHHILHNDLNKKYNDISDKVYSLLYYVIYSDGDTVFFENGKELKRVTPKKGRAILFKSNILHAGSNPINYNYRITTNLVFIKNEFKS